MSKFYIYLHKRISDNIVFYVGKGCRGRSNQKYGRNNLWQKIDKKHGSYVEIYADNLTEDEAFEIERNLIKQYGRINDNTGTLANLTDGGEGVSGWNGTKEFYQARAKVLQQTLLTPKKRAARTEIAKEMHSRPGFNAEHRARMKECQNRPDVSKKKSEGLKKTYNTPEMKAWLQVNRSGKLNSRYDPKVYCFIHSDGKWFVGDRFDFRKEFNLSGSEVSEMVNHNKTRKGWKMAERS
jgi:hypothetical protein